MPLKLSLAVSCRIYYYESKEGQREFAEWKQQQEDNKDVSGDKIA